jgi:gamma-glutamyl phosphate reductase
MRLVRTILNHSFYQLLGSGSSDPTSIANVIELRSLLLVDASFPRQPVDLKLSRMRENRGRLVKCENGSDRVVVRGSFHLHPSVRSNTADPGEL